MESEYWPKIKAIFDSAVLVEREKRDSYLNEACGADTDLRNEVEALLNSFDAAEAFMEKPFAGELADALVGPEENELKTGEVFGRYKIVRRIGTGGMGKVYLAEDTHLRRSVALKLLSCAYTGDADKVARFIQEARFASLLNHPNILTIYEIGQSGNRQFISTEFVTGETLRDRLAKRPISLKDAIAIAIDIASALVVAHEAGIVHRDIKPENVMIRDDGLLKVLDFGLAKLSRPEEDAWDDDVRTLPGLILGTITYMSPEQAGGSEIDARTDIWSLGVVFYEMIAGNPPFAGTSPSNIVESILSSEPELPKQDSPNLRRRLRKIIKKSLAKAVDDRYETIGEMLDDLRRLQIELQTGVGQPPSVAILPFTNVTGDSRMSFFELALADAVITELARSRLLLVRPLSSVVKYLGNATDPLAIGRELKVDAVLAANFLVSKKRIRVTTQLIDVGNNNVLWGEQIDSGADDIIELEDLITNRIVDGMKCELETSVKPDVAIPVTGNSTAYMEYLRGRDQLRRYMFHTVASVNVEIAIEHFKHAIKLDPNFALAHCGLGTCFLQRVIKVVGNREDIIAAATSLDRALALDPHIIDARAYRSFILRLQGEAQRSRDELSELRRSAPDNFEVHYLSAACYRFDGDYENALRCYEEMLRIDPTAEVAIHYCRARIFLYVGEIEKAFAELELAEKIEPNHPIVKFFHAILTLRTGDPVGAADEIRSIFLVYPSVGFRPYLSMCLSASGDYEAARRMLTDDIDAIAEVDPDVSYWLASANSMIGNDDTAFAWLACAIKLGNHNLPWFETDPILAPMRADRRFSELVAPLKQSRSVGIH